MPGHRFLQMPCLFRFCCQLYYAQEGESPLIIDVMRLGSLRGKLSASRHHQSPLGTNNSERGAESSVGCETSGKHSRITRSCNPRIQKDGHDKDSTTQLWHLRIHKNNRHSTNLMSNVSMAQSLSSGPLTQKRSDINSKFTALGMKLQI